jgi:hypothetical protein
MTHSCRSLLTLNAGIATMYLQKMYQDATAHSWVRRLASTILAWAGSPRTKTWQVEDILSIQEGEVNPTLTRKKKHMSEHEDDEVINQ